MIEETKETPYRWVILIVFAAAGFLVSFCQFQPAFFAQDIMSDFGISTTEFSLITSAPMISSFFVALYGGSLADRFGIKRVALIALVLSTIGALGRVFCGDFVSLFIMSMLMGISAAISTGNLTKLAIAWFKPSQISLAVGIGLAIGILGIALAQATTGIMFSDYKTAFLAAGIAMGVLTVLWGIVGRDRVVTPNADEETPKLTESMSEVIRCKHIWIAGLGTMLFNGFNIILGGFLITALVMVWGTNPVLAGLVASVATIGAVIGASVVPAIVSRMNHAKIACVVMPLAAAALVFLGWSVDMFVVRCVCFFIAGFFYGAFNPIFMLYPSVLPEVRPQVAGTAGGLITMIMMAGSIIIPTFIITPIAGDNYWLIIVLACITCALVSVAYALLPSVNGKSSIKPAAKVGINEA